MIRSSFLILAILTACFNDETVSGQTDVSDVWVLKTLNDSSVRPRITIEFPDEGQVAGQAPCNRYFAKQTLPLPWFKLTAIGATKMACPDLKLETQYFNLLQNMTTAEITGDTLILKSDTEQTLIFMKN